MKIAVPSYQVRPGCESMLKFLPKILDPPLKTDYLGMWLTHIAYATNSTKIENKTNHLLVDIGY